MEPKAGASIPGRQKDWAVEREEAVLTGPPTTLQAEPSSPSCGLQIQAMSLLPCHLSPTATALGLHRTQEFTHHIQVHGNGCSLEK